VAITFVNAGTATDNNTVGSGNPTSPGIPASMQAGDWMWLPVHSADNVVLGTVTGWTLKQATNAGTALRQSILWRYWQSGDAAPTIPHTAGDACMCRIFGFRGVGDGSTDPIEAIQTQTGTANATVTAASVTSLSNNAAILGAWAAEVTGNTSGTPTWASYSGTNPTFTEIGDAHVDNANANELSNGIAWGTMTPAGATGTRTAVVSGGAATPTNNIGTLLALTPSAGAATLPPSPLVVDFAVTRAASY
jgi:hypothetical protein